MPRFDSDLESFSTFTGHFGFSATKIGDLAAAEYTLCSITVDRSGSTQGFRPEMIQAIKEIVKACKHSPRADNLMLRVTTFSDEVEEFHGFKLLEACNLDDYDELFAGPGNMTALHDAAQDAGEALLTYGGQLYQADFSVNGILFVITDGLENTSRRGSLKGIKEAFQRATKGELLESLVTILIGVNITDPQASQALKKLQQEAGFTQYVEIAQATKSALAKLAQFVSHSISSQSQSLGSGKASTPLNF